MTGHCERCSFLFVLLSHLYPCSIMADERKNKFLLCPLKPSHQGKEPFFYVIDSACFSETRLLLKPSQIGTFYFLTPTSIYVSRINNLLKRNKQKKKSMQFLIIYIFFSNCQRSRAREMERRKEGERTAAPIGGWSYCYPFLSISPPC